MRKFRKLLSLVLLAVFLFSTAMIVKQMFDSRTQAAAQSSALQLATAPQVSTGENEEPAPSAPQDTDQPDKLWIPAPVEDDPNMDALQNINLDALRSVNPEVVGWILIPDTGIDFPLTQAQDNSFYLDHTWDLQKSSHGTIFLECMNSPDMTDFNTIIYGHHMRDGSMFAPLRHYEDQSWFEANPYVYIVTDEGVFRYEIFSSYLAPLDSITYGLDFTLEEKKAELLEMALAESQIDTGITPATTDRIITLSTCTGWGYESRRVVLARLEMDQIFQR